MVKGRKSQKNTDHLLKILRTDINLTMAWTDGHKTGTRHETQNDYLNLLQRYGNICCITFIRQTYNKGIQP